MSETLVAVFCVAFLLLAFFWYYSHRNVNRRLQDYRNLFDEAQAKLEGLFQTVNSQNIELALSVQVLEDSEALRKGLQQEISILSSAVEFQEEQYKKLFSQKKSSEVRTGKITEQIAPFLEDYPLDSRTARFIGDPIDFVHFDEDKVTFVEVKSGKSQLSTKQRHIRDLVKEGKVDFTIYRVEGK